MATMNFETFKQNKSVNMNVESSSKKEKKVNKRDYSHLLKFEKTQIYRDGLKAAVEIHKLVSKFEKTFKYDFGAKLCTYALELFENISWACMEDDKKEKIDILKYVQYCALRTLLVLRISNDLNMVSKKSYVDVVSLVISVLGQAKSWHTKLTLETAEETEA